MGIEFWVQILVYAVSIGSLAGVVLTRVKYLEKKMDRYNNLQERMVISEQSLKAVHRRLDDIKK